jgi:citrate lyase subunit beta/citryl-CoA lyase
MRLRSLLFVPGDRPDRFDKAAASGADALILDLEDSVAASARPAARAAVAEYLARPHPLPIFVRVNPLQSGLAEDDMAAIIATPPAGIILPKAEGAESLRTLDALLGRAGAHADGVTILPIATETPAAIFQLGSYGGVTRRLIALSWGAEDLPAAIGATAAREADGRYTAPIELARSLALFAAAAAGVAPIETVYPDFRDLEGLARYAARGARDGFTGMLAIHPAQIEAINAAFTPAPEAVKAARAIVDAFAANPKAGVLAIDGKMVDRPHLIQAERLLSRAAD